MLHTYAIRTFTSLCKAYCTISDVMKNALYFIILTSNKTKLLVKEALQFKYPTKETIQH